MFDEQYETLTSREKEEFARTINVLLLKSFVLRDMYDRHSKMMKPNPDYAFLERKIDLVRTYLQFSGWIIEKDSHHGVILIQNEYQDNRIRMDFLTSLLIYGLRYAYEIERQENQLAQEVYFNSSSLMQLLLDKGLIRLDKRPTTVALAQAYRFLENHHIIARISGDFRDRDLQFYILPTILFLIDHDRINAIFDQVEKDQLDEEME